MTLEETELELNVKHIEAIKEYVESYCQANNITTMVAISVIDNNKVAEEHKVTRALFHIGIRKLRVPLFEAMACMMASNLDDEGNILLT